MESTRVNTKSYLQIKTALCKYKIRCLLGYMHLEYRVYTFQCAFKWG